MNILFAMRRWRVFILALLLMSSSVLFAQESIPPSFNWPIQPGESIDDLARLFYPKNPAMQRYFARETYQLNHEALAGSATSTVFQQETQILIPDIRSLSRFSPPRAQAQNAASAKHFGMQPTLEPTAKQLAEIDQLHARNAAFQAELDVFSRKITQLQEIFISIKQQLLALIDRIEAADAQTKLNEQLVAESANQAVTATAAVAPKPEQALQAQTELSATHDEASSEEHSVVGLPAIVPIAIGLVLLAVLGALIRYRRRQNATISTTVETLHPLDKNAFEEEAIDIDAVKEAARIKREQAFLNSEPMPDMEEFVQEASDSIEHIEDGDLLLEQAKIYVSLGDVTEAVRLLESYVATSPATALPQCLYLLEIYQQTNQQAAFAACAQHLHENFNVELPQWQTEKADDKTSIPCNSLEEYPHIVNQLTQLWAACAQETADAYVQSKAYLDKLLTDIRDHERGGFSKEVFDEIILLRGMLGAREKLARSD
ncbi:MAG: hypothetical protein CVU29_05685 [Betaproteobacteria bacterium HGW-Betaproteobacteria-22]|nr:MAG: hypothetical protein CVU29_05685 [Betaproteobacteria bacterium HGW-Betaproteobacteria-22]